MKPRIRAIPDGYWCVGNYSDAFKVRTFIYWATGRTPAEAFKNYTERNK